MLNVAIIGCGLVSDQHAGQVKRTTGARLAAVCDAERLMADQLADRFGVPAVFTDAAEMLQKVKPDVVHITTPAQSHLALARLCLDAGAHIYVEKPFTLNAADAEALLEHAEARGRKVTVGHNLQFSSEAIRMRALVATGFLGGHPRHLESLQGFSHMDPVYGPALLGDRHHWVRRLPGSLLQNLISHGVAKLAEFLPEGKMEVIADPFTSPHLQQCEQADITDELRSIIHCHDGTTAYFTFTTRLGIPLNELRLYGTTNSLIVDSVNRMLVPIRQTGYKSYLRHFLAPRAIAKAYRRNSWQNIAQFLRRDFHQDSSMKNLVQAFYKSITDKAPVPIPYGQILTTTRIMDAMFRTIGTRRS